MYIGRDTEQAQSPKQEKRAYACYCGQGNSCQQIFLSLYFFPPLSDPLHYPANPCCMRGVQIHADHFKLLLSLLLFPSGAAMLERAGARRLDRITWTEYLWHASRCKHRRGMHRAADDVWHLQLSSRISRI